jgi:hypothetical protein
MGAAGGKGRLGAPRPVIRLQREWKITGVMRYGAGDWDSVRCTRAVHGHRLSHHEVVLAVHIWQLAFPSGILGE